MTPNVLEQFHILRCVKPECRAPVACTYTTDPAPGYRIVCDAGHPNGFLPDRPPKAPLARTAVH